MTTTQITDIVQIDEDGFCLTSKGAALADVVNEAIVQAAVKFSQENEISVAVLDISIILGIISQHYEEQLEGDLARIEQKNAEKGEEA